MKGLNNYDGNFILTEMGECRKYCSLINRARNEAGFNSLKYPITDVKINRYFLPEFAKIIADECNIVGYMDIAPLEFELEPQIGLGEEKTWETIWDVEVPLNYFRLVDENKKVLISTVRSDWQQKIFDERKERRANAENKKYEDINAE